MTWDTRSQSYTTPCGPDWSARADRTPSRRSTSTRCSTSRRRPRRRRHEVRRRRSVPVRSARQHRLDQRRPAAARRQDPRQGSHGRLAGRAGVAADRRRLGDGQRRGAEGVPDAGAQGVPIGRKLRRPRRPPLRRRPHRLGRQSGGVGEGSRRQHEEDRRDLPRRPPTSRKSTGERLAAEGEICWGGMHSVQRERRAAGDGGPAARPSASRPTWRTRCSSRMGYNAPEDRLLPEGFDWSDQTDGSTRR